MKKKNTFLKLMLIFSMLIISVLLTSVGVFAADEPEVVIFEDYNRPDLGVTGEGGAYNSPNSAGIAIYWIQMRNVTAQVENNALKLAMDKEAWFGEGVAFKNPNYKYIIMKIKGEKGGEEKFLTINPDAVGLKKFSELKGPDGKPVPAITKEYRDIVIDIAKSGLDLPTGFEAMHFNNSGPLTVYIDEIYLSKTGVPTDISKFALAPPSADTAGEDTLQADAGDTADAGGSTAGLSTGAGEDNSSDAAAITSTSAEQSGSDTLQDSGIKENSSKDNIFQIAIIILIMVLLMAVVVYNSFVRKPAAEK